MRSCLYALMRVHFRLGVRAGVQSRSRTWKIDAHHERHIIVANRAQSRWWPQHTPCTCPESEPVSRGHRLDSDTVTNCDVEQFLNSWCSFRGCQHRIMHDESSHCCESQQVSRATEVVKIRMTDDDRFDLAASRIDFGKHDS